MRPTRGLFAHLALGNYLLNTCYVLYFRYIQLMSITIPHTWYTYIFDDHVADKKPALDCLLSLKENQEGAEGRGGCTQAKQHDGREKYCEVEGLSLLVIDQKVAMWDEVKFDFF